MKPDSSTEPEDDFWDLGDDDDLDINTAENTQQDKLSLSPELAPISDDTTSKVDPPEKLDESESEALETADEVEEKEESIESSQEEPEEDKAEGENSHDETGPASTGQTLNAAKDKTSSAVAELSGIEKASLVAVIALLIGAAAWGLATFYNNAPEGTLIHFDEDFPIEGSNITVEDIETYWREPIRKGDNLDLGVQLTARLIPCSRLKISGSGSASLALSFRDSDKKLVGDPLSLEVSNGKFTKNGSNEIIVNCTAGFNDVSAINPYANGDVKPWSLLIVEGDSGTTPSHLNDEKKLVVVRIEPRSISNETK